MSVFLVFFSSLFVGASLNLFASRFFGLLDGWLHKGFWAVTIIPIVMILTSAEVSQNSGIKSALILGYMLGILISAFWLIKTALRRSKIKGDPSNDPK